LCVGKVFKFSPLALIYTPVIIHPQLILALSRFMESVGSSHSLSVSNDASVTSNDGRPEQGTFSSTEKEYLNTFLEEYLTAPSTHGAKKKWVKLNVYPKYIEKYNSAGPDGPNLASLLTVGSLVNQRL
jgi:hypothetical protein